MHILAAAPAPGGMNLSILWVALVAIFTSITAPLMLAYMTSRQQRQTKLEDYARQDKVARDASDQASLLAANQRDAAERAERTARLLLENQRDAIARTDEVARLAAETAKRADGKLDQIHTLVNSDMTAARQSELDQTREMLTAQKRIVALSTLRGKLADPADTEAVKRTEARIGELEMILADRLTQLRKVEAEAAAHPSVQAARDADPKVDPE